MFDEASDSKVTTSSVENKDLQRVFSDFFMSKKVTIEIPFESQTSEDADSAIPFNKMINDDHDDLSLEPRKNSNE